jgi:lysozyme|tara:strand:+ start:2086 stop:2514 length:429 start_codon:yes stop_codon:yes gene_type:complete
MTPSNDCIDMVKHFEGFKAVAYLCPANVWTIGYGRTKNVKDGDITSMPQATRDLEEELVEFGDQVHRVVDVELSQNEFDALTSWTYNLGVGNLQSSTLLKKLNAGDKDSVPSEMLRWNKAAGKVLAGLTTRRQAEADLWEKE